MSPRTPVNILLRAMTLGCLCFVLGDTALLARRGVYINPWMWALLAGALGVVAVHTVIWLKAAPVPGAGLDRRL